MKKIFKYFIFVFAAFAIINGNVFAVENVRKYSRGDNYIYVDKNNYQILDDVVQFDLQMKQYFSLGELIVDNNVRIYMYTNVDDIVFQNEDLWWSTIYYCVKVEGGFGSLGADEAAMVFTDSLSSIITGENKDKFIGLFGTMQECKTMTVEDVDEDKQVSYCELYEILRQKILNYKDSYLDTKNIAYKIKYKQTLDDLKSACNQAMSAADWNDACVNRCSYLSREAADWDKIFSPTNPTNDCGFSDKLLAWILNIIKWVKYILPVLVIILGIIDFIKAIGADKDDEMKKAQSRFIKRLIAAALVFLVPLIIEFILKKFGFNSTCGLF